MGNDKKILLDIQDRQKTFESIANRLELLDEGFRALYADYSHHIEVTNGKQHDILRLKENIDYRLFSSKFHLELLLRQHFAIEGRIQEIFRDDPGKVLNPVYPSHPLFDYCEREITSVFDSIIFHLASVYDYLSAAINFICNKKDKSITKWSQLAKSCRDRENTYSGKKIASVIISENENFVDKLYRYRSRVIHERSEINAISLSLKIASSKAVVKFISTDGLIKSFPSLKEKAKTHNLTVAFTSEWLIHATIDSIVNILFSMKEEMEQMSTFPDHIADADFILLYTDPKTGHAGPASKPLWENLKNNINKR
ncbi:hypothetical protein GO495_02195 [Chitinophaga oryziterrae]|uniref:Cthe-2314-like HEPN domain-containing protein n=1 Tax=Chitinophaga oryziterrae TaxID=1031224 RepID=A0A6N8J374_9BACT|nr:hypothetical protein [Chitinophaga oryziterrae]MVT39384.1 hypothetical protein [Chitinophaga oryziterrae]